MYSIYYENGKCQLEFSDPGYNDLLPPIYAHPSEISLNFFLSEMASSLLPLSYGSAHSTINGP